MSDDQRVYSDEEFALILRKATELASEAEPLGSTSAGLTLTEMKAVAAEIGMDPALVERAARLLPANSSVSLFERLIGGPLCHGSEVRIPVMLDEAKTAQILAAVQIHAGQPGNGHSNSFGMVWHAAREEVEALSVTAQPEDGGTSIAVRLDRTGTLAVMSVAILIGLVMAISAGLVLGQEAGPVLGVAAGVSGMSGILALLRSYWASSTKHVRERVSGVVDAIGQVIAQSERPPSVSGAIGDYSGNPEIEVETLGDSGSRTVSVTPLVPEARHRPLRSGR